MIVIWFVIPFLYILQSKDKSERELKRAHHNFVAVTLANSKCNHCSLLLNYKPSVQCSSMYHTPINYYKTNSNRERLSWLSGGIWVRFEHFLMSVLFVGSVGV